MNAQRKATPLSARGYLRVSLDKSGRARSLDEQHDENAAAAEREGWTLATPYRDESVSASRYARKTRKGYDALVSDLESGRFGADILLIWESSRGSRRVSEWVTLIELCEAQHVKIHVTTHSRTYDPANVRDRRSLLEDSVDSEYESGKASVRSQRAAAANAAAGRWHGKVPYGYRRRFDPDTGRTVAQEPQPDEANVVRELFDRLRRGHTLNSIAADFTSRGIRTRSGRPWRPEHLRDVAMRASYAGIRVHNGTEYPAAWDAIVDKATFYAVKRRLSDATRKTPRPGRGKHLLSQIARCAVCGGRLTARLNDAVPLYMCHDKGHIRIAQTGLDELAGKVIVAYLSRPDIYDTLSATGGDDGSLDTVRGEIAELRARLDEIGDAVATGEMSAALAGRVEVKVQAALDAAIERERALSTPPALTSLIAPGADAARRWKSAPLATKREIAKLLLAPEILGQLRVQRCGRRPGVPAHERVEWWHGDI